MYRISLATTLAVFALSSIPADVNAGWRDKANALKNKAKETAAIAANKSMELSKQGYEAAKNSDIVKGTQAELGRIAKDAQSGVKREVDKNLKSLERSVQKGLQGAERAINQEVNNFGKALQQAH